jgi:hypothetical protein
MIQDRDLTTIEMMWCSTFPRFAVPHIRHRVTWLNKHPLATVLAAIEHAATSGERFRDAEHCGKVVSTLLKNVTYQQ